MYEKSDFFADFSRKRCDKFQRLFDENGLPVRVELEKNADGVVLAVLRRELSEDEQQKICMDYEHCQDCPLWEQCDAECDEI